MEATAKAGQPFCRLPHATCPMKDFNLPLPLELPHSRFHRAKSKGFGSSCSQRREANAHSDMFQWPEWIWLCPYSEHRKKQPSRLPTARRCILSYHSNKYTTNAPGKCTSNKYVVSVKLMIGHPKGNKNRRWTRKQHTGVCLLRITCPIGFKGKSTGSHLLQMSILRNPTSCFLIRHLLEARQFRLVLERTRDQGFQFSLDSTAISPSLFPESHTQYLRKKCLLKRTMPEENGKLAAEHKCHTLAKRPPALKGKCLALTVKVRDN